MRDYLIRRLLSAVPILIGVMLLTFVLFFVFQTPRAMALRILGPKAPAEAIENWLHNRGYDKPRFLNLRPGARLWDSQFVNHLSALARFDLGHSDATGEPVLEMFKRGMVPSLLITVPVFVAGLCLAVGAALLLVMARESALDLAGALACVMMMSVPYMVWVIFGQWLMGVRLTWFPAFGFDLSGWSTARFLVLPVALAVFAGLGADTRLYRAIFLEEIRQDYVRTARAKGASGRRILFVHVLKNGMISLVTLVVASLPFLIMGSLVLESFFGIPGLGNLMMNAIRTSDFAVVRASVWLGSLLYLAGLLLTDLAYALVDPRVRFR
ncbi:MAG: ABC transporter permease [Verrucomicrobiae bacterium]|nr:ABC transporter permease [Verrucomicrobiae bacterium]